MRTAADDRDEAHRRAEVLASSRRRRAMHELDAWLAGQPADDPPFADAYDSPTVVGVGPWNAFFARSLTAF